MRRSAALTLILGMWIGATIAMLSAVAYDFIGIDRAVEANERLRDAVSFEVGDDVARRQSVLFVYAGELNRSMLAGFNRAQLAIGAFALLVAVLRRARTGVVLPLIVAAVLVLVMTFWLAPEITRLGRSLDFVPRPVSGGEPHPGFARFDELHRAYLWVEVAKTGLVALAGGLALFGRRPAPRAAEA